MSWLSEEWKSQIPSDALVHIVEMEEKFEKIKKDLSRYQFKSESLENELQNAKQRLEERAGDIKQLERQVSNINDELHQEKENFKSIEGSLQTKDNVISDLRAEVDRLRTDLLEQRSYATKLSNELEKVTEEQEENESRKHNDVGRLMGLKILNEQRVEELKQQIESLCKDKQDQEVTYENKIQELITENSQGQGLVKNLSKQISAMELTMQNVEIENHAHRQTSDSQLTNIEQLRKSLHEKNEKIEELKTKIKKHKCEIGDYLGINVRKICSDSSVSAQDFTRLMDSSKALEKENDELKKIISHQKDVIENRRSGSTGVVLKTTNVQCSMESNDEIVVSRMLGEQTPHTQNELEHEIKKLKEENSRMHEIYENHMKVCSNNIRIARKSSSTYSHTGESDELRRTVMFLEQQKVQLEKVLTEKNDECIQLYQEIGSLKNTEFSDQVANKLEDLVDVILQQKKSSMINCVASTTSSLDIESLKSVVHDRIKCLQEEFLADCKATRESIKANTKRILSAVLKSSTSTIGEKCVRIESARMHTPTVKTMSGIHCLDEIETIRERIDYLQQSVYDREGEFRKVQKDRDCVQVELVKMMELMKKKDEELSRISCLYELEKQKVTDNESCYRAEMEALKLEQLDIYKEFREMCDNLKRKDIELLNKSKQNKLLSAEWREKEDNLNEHILAIEKDLYRVQNEKDNLQIDLDSVTKEKEMLLCRLNHSEEQLQGLYDSLSRIEDLMFKAKGDGLYC